MTRCDKMRKGDVYVCEKCGLEIEVVEECSHEDDDEASETCEVTGFVCCGEELSLKK